MVIIPCGHLMALKVCKFYGVAWSPCCYARVLHMKQKEGQSDGSKKGSYYKV